jgi:3-oxoacyl-[acyl-carrier protein] reductase
MNLNLSGRVAVVLGSSSGLGLGAAMALAEEGCRLALCSRSASNISRVAERIQSNFNTQVYCSSVDLSVKDELEAFIDHAQDKFGRIDILVNNTGGPKPGPAIKFSPDDYQDAFDLLLMSKINATLRVLPGMIKQRKGVIINIESTSAIEPLRNMVLSNTFRSAALSFAKTIALEHAKDNITVKTILSGPFMTNRVEELGNANADHQGVSFDEWLSNAVMNVPLNRFGNPSEYGKLVAYLASEWSDFMTGNTIAFDGGCMSSL